MRVPVKKHLELIIYMDRVVYGLSSGGFAGSRLQFSCKPNPAFQTGPGQFLNKGAWHKSPYT